MGKNNEFFELLCLNSSDAQDKLHKFLISNGKAPKPRCPIQFFDKEEFEKNYVENSLEKIS